MLARGRPGVWRHACPPPCPPPPHQALKIGVPARQSIEDGQRPHRSTPDNPPAAAIRAAWTSPPTRPSMSATWPRRSKSRVSTARGQRARSSVGSRAQVQLRAAWLLACPSTEHARTLGSSTGGRARRGWPCRRYCHLPPPTPPARRRLPLAASACRAEAAAVCPVWAVWQDCGHCDDADRPAAWPGTPAAVSPGAAVRLCAACWRGCWGRPRLWAARSIEPAAPALSICRPGSCLRTLGRPQMRCAACRTSPSLTNPW